MKEVRLIGLKSLCLECTPLLGLGIKITIAFLQARVSTLYTHEGRIPSPPLLQEHKPQSIRTQGVERGERANRLPNTTYRDNISGQIPVLPRNSSCGRPNTVHSFTGTTPGKWVLTSNFSEQNFILQKQVKIWRDCLSYFWVIQLAPCAASTSPVRY